MKKYLIGILACITLLACLLVGCGKKDDGPGTDSGTSPTHEHTLTHVDGVAATCTQDGNKEYWECSDCNKKFADEAAQTEITDAVIPATGHNSEGTVAHVDATCTQDGVQGGNYCTACNEGKEAAESVLPAIGHKYDANGFCTAEGCNADLYTEIIWVSEDAPIILTPIDGKIYIKYRSSCAHEDFDPIYIDMLHSFPNGTSLEQAKADSFVSAVAIYKNKDFENELSEDLGGKFELDSWSDFYYVTEQPLDKETDYYFVLTVNEEKMETAKQETVTVTFKNLYGHELEGGRCTECGEKCNHVFSSVGVCKYCKTLEAGLSMIYTGGDVLPNQSVLLPELGVYSDGIVDVQFFFDDVNFIVSIYDGAIQPAKENMKSGDVVGINGNTYYLIKITNISETTKSPELMWHCANNACIDEDEDGLCDVCNMPFALATEVKVGDDCVGEGALKLDLSQKSEDYKVTLVLRGVNCGAFIATSVVDHVARLDSDEDVFTATITGGYVYYIVVDGSETTVLAIVEGAEVAKVNPHFAWDDVYTLDKTYDGEAVFIPRGAYYSNNCPVNATVEWFKKGETTPLASAPKDAGEYTVVITNAATAVYNEAKITIDFTISQAENTLKFADDLSLNKSYDDTPVSIPDDAYTTNSNGAVTVEWYTGTEVIDANKLTVAPKDVGTYIVVIKQAETQNYTARQIELTFTIAKAETTIAFKTGYSLSKIYNGTAVSAPTAEDYNVSIDGEVTVEWYQGETKLESAPVKPGTYSAKISIAGDENHNSATAEHVFTIAQAETTYMLIESLTAESSGTYVKGLLKKDFTIADSLGISVAVRYADGTVKTQRSLK